MADEPETLESLLVEKTGRPEEEIQQQLQELVTRIEEVARTGDRFHIQGFGTFTGNYGALYFEPSERLQTEINHQYAGMQPIELVEAFKEAGAGVPVEQRPEPEEPPSSLQKPEQQPDYSRELPLEPESEEETAKPGMAAEKAEKAEAADAIPKKAAATKTRKKEYSFDRRRNGGGTWIAAAVLFIVVILAVGWLFFTNRSSPKKEISQTTTAVPADSVNSKTLSEKQAKNPGRQQVSGSTMSGGDVADKKTAAGDSLTAKYGLMGNPRHQAGKAYTIVIHSFRFKTTVQEIADTLSRQGYRTVVFRGAGSSDIPWRLGLGQFKTIKDAQQAVRQLPERYQKAHFIHRINH